MTKTYVYLHHQGFDFFLSDRKLSKEECYCAACDESDELVGEYADEQTFADKLKDLFKEGLDFIEGRGYDYNEIKDKYCPVELREWEKGQFEEDSEEYKNLKEHFERLKEEKRHEAV